MKKHAIFDTECIGDKAPVFLTCVKIHETGEKFTFWHDKRGHTAKLEKMLKRDDLTWVGFNSENFDRPMIAAAVMGHDEEDLKMLATHIIENEMRSWQTYKTFNLDFIDYDHIDLIEVAPGVMVSLKTYAGRMGYPTMKDMPFDHRHDVTPAERKEVEQYCFNDIGVTEKLFVSLKPELELRAELSAEYGIDLRSKSDAQIAEAILKKRVGIASFDKVIPRAIEYRAPDFIRSENQLINNLIEALESTEFKINRANGSPELPSFLEEPIKLGCGVYKCGLGGLHSQHDTCVHFEATDKILYSDFDVASYYPNIMMKAGLVPRLGGDRGQKFLDEYRHIYEARIAAKRAGNKKVSNSLKITLNGTFGKLGNMYCSFYSPDLMLAVTISGQLNLLCLIDELEQIPQVFVRSANTDGVLVEYPAKQRTKVLKVFERNAKRTGFEYEETPYRTVAMKDVNNYVAVTVDGKIKGKGLYAEKSLMKNPTMQVCADAVSAYLKDGILPEEFIPTVTDMADFVAIRNVKGGGVQHTKTQIVDEWELVEDFGTAENKWVCRITGKVKHRKSRPEPVEWYTGGEPFGRVARWYMTKQDLPPITYCGSGNKVPKTEGAKLCMTLPNKKPADLDIDWYIDEARRMLASMGVKEFAEYAC